jgi:formate dehydrogenase major subunit
MDGGGCFRANFGVERDGVSLLAADGSHRKGSDLTTGYPEFDHVLMKKLGWWDELTDDEKRRPKARTGKPTLRRHHPRRDEGPRLPSVRQRQGARRRLELPRRRSRSIASRCTRRARHGGEVSDARRQEGVLASADAVQERSRRRTSRQGREELPADAHQGRLVEYEGGGDETRSNPWLAELQQENFIEINPKDANDRGVIDGEYVWVKSPTGAQISVKAMITDRVGAGTTFIPFHFAGWWQGKDMLEFYPEGAAPIVRAEAVNTATTYGYDSVTMMQETKTTLCQVAKKA